MAINYEILESDNRIALVRFYDENNMEYRRKINVPPEGVSSEQFTEIVESHLRTLIYRLEIGMAQLYPPPSD